MSLARAAAAKVLAGPVRGALRRKAGAVVPGRRPGEGLLWLASGEILDDGELLGRLREGLEEGTDSLVLALLPGEFVAELDEALADAVEDLARRIR